MKECDQYSGQDLNPERTRQLLNPKPSGPNGDTDMIVTGAIDFKGDHIKMSASQHKGISMGATSTNLGGNSKYGSITGIVVETEGKSSEAGKRKRIASPDLWEYTRLKGGNVLNLVNDENFKDLENAAEDNELNEEVPEIELNDEEPPFLMGQTTKAGLCLSPIKIS